jgi:hypothetical protein
MLRHSAVIHRHQRAAMLTFGWRHVGVAILLGSALDFSDARADTIGPDSFGYTATNQVSFTFSDISGSGTKVLAGVDDGFVLAPLGFSFSFYGTDYSDAFLSTNGLITFTTGTLQFGNVDLTTSGPSG